MDELESKRLAGQDRWGNCLLLLEALDALILQGCFLSFLNMVFLLTTSLDNHVNLDLSVLLDLTNVSSVSSIVRGMWLANFQGCRDLTPAERYNLGVQSSSNWALE